MKTILFLIFAAFLLTSCSNPDTSGGVTLSRGADDGNEFPNGSCEGPHKNPPDGGSGCGWVTANDKSYYIMPDANLSSANLEGANLIGADLNGANLFNARFVSANLSGANLANTTLSVTSFISANLTNVDLSHAKTSPWIDFRHSNLTKSNFTGWDLTNASFNGNDGSYLFAGATLAGINLSETGANLSGMNLSGVNLSGANLSGVNLSGANLTKANLDGVNLAGATLTGTLLEGAVLCNTTMPSGTVIFSGC